MKRYIYGTAYRRATDGEMHIVWGETTYETKEACVEDAQLNKITGTLIFVAAETEDKKFPDKYELWDPDTGEYVGSRIVGPDGSLTESDFRI